MKPKDDGQSPARRPDPSEFEAPLKEDEPEEPAQSATTEGGENTEVMVVNPNPPTEVEGEKESEKLGSVQPQPPVELPAEVKSKLRRLENMEPRYKGK